MQETLLGITLLEFNELIKFVERHHRYTLFLTDDTIEYRKRLLPKLDPEQGFKIKYIDTCYDSRTNTFWSITFRKGSSYGYKFTTNHYDKFNPPPKDWKFHTLYELCMAYLKGEFEPGDEFLIKY